MELLSIHAEFSSEEGEHYRVRYSLWEERDGEELLYGIGSYAEGRECRYGGSYRSPALFGCRQIGEAVLEYLAEHGVMPLHTEDILQELLL